MAMDAETGIRLNTAVGDAMAALEKLYAALREIQVLTFPEEVRDEVRERLDAAETVAEAVAEEQVRSRLGEGCPRCGPLAEVMVRKDGSSFCTRCGGAVTGRKN